MRSMSKLGFIKSVPDNTIINDTNIRYLIYIYMNEKYKLSGRFKIINSWDVSRVTNMSNLFTSYPNFNQPINN